MALTSVKLSNNTTDTINDARLPASLGTAGQVLKMNSAATGIEWGTGGTSVSISTTGTATTEAKYITVDGVEWKLPSGSSPQGYINVTSFAGATVTIGSVSYTYGDQETTHQFGPYDYGTYSVTASKSGYDYSGTTAAALASMLCQVTCKPQHIPFTYQELQYIYNTTSNCWLDTLISPVTEKTVVEIKGMITNSNSAFGGMGSGSTLFNTTAITATRIPFRYGTSESHGISSTSGEFYSTPATLKVGNGAFYLDGVLRSTFTEAAFTWNYTMKIWARGTSGDDQAIGQLYFARVYSEDTLLWEGYPATRLEDSAIGMYDTVSDTFFVNQGTGTFIPGDPI